MELIIIIALLITFVLGSIRDFQIREVPDTLNYSLLVFALSYFLYKSIIELSFTPILQSLAGLLVAFVFSMTLFYFGQWGGGDAKMLWGVGAALGFPIQNIMLQNDLVLFILLAMICGAIYGLIWMAVLAIKNFKSFKNSFKEKFFDEKYAFYKKLYFVLSAVLILLVFLFNPFIEILFLTILLVISIPLMFLVSISVKIIEDKCMIKKISTSKLVEGDWIVSSHKIKGKLLEIPRTGIEKEQIDALKKANIKQVIVKEGIPFVPSFLFAFIVMLIMGF